MGDRRNIRPLAAGVIVAIGLFRTWIASDFLLVAYFLRRKEFPFPPISITVFAAIPALTVFWSDDIIASFLWFPRIILLYSLLADNQGKQKIVAIPVMLAMSIQAILALFVFTDHRPIIFSPNSEVFAATGFVLMNPFSWVLAIIGGVTVGVTQARFTPALMGIAILLTRFNRKIIVATIIAGSLFVISAAVNAPDRLQFNTLFDDYIKRTSLIDLSNKEYAKHSILIHQPELADREIERQWRWYGYGYRSYVLETAAITPHNLWVLTWYELGIFSVPFWISLAWSARRLTGWIAATAILYFSVVDLWFWFPSGVYGLGYLAYNWSCSSRVKGITRPSGSTIPLS